LKKSFETDCEKAGVLYVQKTPNGILFKDIRRAVKEKSLKQIMPKGLVLLVRLP